MPASRTQSTLGQASSSRSRTQPTSGRRTSKRPMSEESVALQVDHLYRQMKGNLPANHPYKLLGSGAHQRAVTTSPHLLAEALPITRKPQKPSNVHTPTAPMTNHAQYSHHTMHLEGTLAANIHRGQSAVHAHVLAPPSIPVARTNFATDQFARPMPQTVEPLNSFPVHHDQPRSYGHPISFAVQQSAGFPVFSNPFIVPMQYHHQAPAFSMQPQAQTVVPTRHFQSRPPQAPVTYAAPVSNNHRANPQTGINPASLHTSQPWH